MLVLLVANVANTVAEFSGAAAALEIFGISRYIAVPITAIAIWALVIKARYETVERVFLSVIVVFLAYIASAILARPDWGEVGQGARDALVRLVDRDAAPDGRVVGTTMTPYMQFYLTSAVAEKGIGEDELSLEQADAIGGSVWTNVIAIFIVVATATTIGATGGTIETAADAAAGAGAGRRAAGRGAVRGRAVRGERAGRDDHAALDRVRDLRGVRLGVRCRPALLGRPGVLLDLHVRAGVGALVVLIPGLDLLPLIIASQNLQGLLLPVVLVFMVLLANDRRLMGDHRNGRVGNVLAWAAVGVVVALDAVLLGVAALGHVRGPRRLSRTGRPPGAPARRRAQCVWLRRCRGLAGQSRPSVPAP